MKFLLMIIALFAVMMATAVIAQEEVNQPPIVMVDAACREINIEESYGWIYLGRDAVIQDETPLNELSYVWSIVSSPEESIVVINDPNVLLASACVDIVGEYVFELTVSDGALAAFDMVTVNVIAGN